MGFGSINWLAVVVCVMVALIVGSVWFNPRTFYPMWLKAIGRSQTENAGGANPAVMWGLTVLAALLQAVFMSLLVHALGSVTAGGASAGSGALVGLALWLGFVAPASLSNKLFENRLMAWLVEAGNHLITYLLMGAILGAWH